MSQRGLSFCSLGIDLLPLARANIMTAKMHITPNGVTLNIAKTSHRRQQEKETQ